MSHEAAACGNPYYIDDMAATWWTMPFLMRVDFENGHAAYPVNSCKAVLRWWGVLNKPAGIMCVQHGENEEHRREFDIGPLGLEYSQEWVPFVDPEVTAWLDEIHVREAIHD